MKTTVTKRFRFEAAHFLPGYIGPCVNLHGHSYILEVSVYHAQEVLKDGMILDFSILKSFVTDYIKEYLDHKLLNDTLPIRTTAEEMSRLIFLQLNNRFASAPEMEGIRVCRLRLYETADSYAEVEE